MHIPPRTVARQAASTARPRRAIPAVMARWLILLAGLTLLAVAGCDRRWLRDDYMGRDWLEPELTPQAAPRDDLGNPMPMPPRR